jgi:hypothetical protein
MAPDSIECPDCGATVGSRDDVDVEETREIEDRPRGGIGYGDATRNLFLCKNCKNPLGVGSRDSE